jgi:integrase
MSIRSRRLSSGRTSYDVRLRAPDGHQYTKSFRTRKEAEAYIVQERAAQIQGTWVDPAAGKVQLDVYSSTWLAQRPALRPRTIELYEYLLRRFVLPELGPKSLDKITPMMIRAWHARLRTEHGVSATTAAKAYRLLRSLLTTALDDELIGRNPCILRGAGVERSAERPVISVAEVATLSDVIDPRYRALVLLATWAGLRFGEAAALRRGDIELASGTVRIERQLQELKSGERQEGPPKTEAGKRVVSLPPHVLPELERHLKVNVDTGTSSLVFTSPDGTYLRRSNSNRRVWQPACKEMGLHGFHFHDLRHTGSTFAASTGASTKELMARMGHSSPRAALIYQHATRDRDQALADALSKLVEEPAQSPPRLSLVEDAEDQWCISGAYPDDRDPAKDVTKGKSPDRTAWRRWDSNPRPPACKYARPGRWRTVANAFA